MDINPQNLDWLLGGDPSIRWQVQRDLLEEKPEVYEKERSRVALEGWGAELLSRQDPNGTWANALYSPKWTSTTYTLLLLMQLGLAHENPQAQRGCEHFLARGLERDGGINFWKSYHHSETCVNGMLLALLAYFRSPDERVHSLVGFLLREQMPDGGWNCERVRGATHGSFHTTILTLEGLHEYGLIHPLPAPAREAVQRAHEFLLLHRLYRSHRSGEIVDPAMTRLHFPPRWHYDILRALDYFRAVNAGRDERMGDAIGLLKEKQGGDGRWVLNTPWPGRVYFNLEAASQPSRWNTLRALRVLKWWEG